MLATVMVLLVALPGTAGADEAVTVDAHHASLINRPPVIVTDARHAALVVHAGARPLVDMKSNDKMAIVIQEILQDKIFLDQSGNLVMRGASAGDAVRRAMLTDISDVGGADD